MSMYLGKNETGHAVMEALDLLRKYPHQWITYNPNDPLANSVVTYLKRQGKVVVNRFHQYQAAPKYRVNPGRSQAQKNMKSKRRGYEGSTKVATHLQMSRSAESKGDYRRALQHAKAALVAHDVSAEFGKGDTNRFRIIERMSEVFEKLHGKYKKNPAPGIAERSEKLHAIRKRFVKDMNAAKRNGNRVREDYMIRKLLKLDRILYAQPGNTMRAKLRNSSRKKNPGPKANRYSRLKKVADAADAAFTRALKKQFPKERAGDARYKSSRFNAATKKASARSRKATDALLAFIRGK